MNVLYLVSGFPSKSAPEKGIFNKRAADALSEKCNLQVVHFRFFKIGRSFIQKENEGNYKKIVISVPYVPVFDSYFYWINYRIFYYFLLLFCKKEINQTDVIHAADGNLGNISIWLKKRYQKPVVIQFIGGDLNRDFLPHINKIQKLYSNSRGIQFGFNSSSLKTRFQDLFKVQNSNLHIIYRGVNVDKFKKPLINERGETKFYFLGGLPNYRSFKHGRNTKGGMVLMDAWSKIDSENKIENASLVFAGPDSDIELAVKWKEGLLQKDKVKLKGKVLPSRLVKFHHDNSVLLIPSLEEGLPNVLLEGGASGNAIIASNTGGIPEVITNEEQGILVEAGNVEELADSILQLIKSQKKISELGENIKDRIHSSFSDKNFSSSYLHLYQMLQKQK